MPFWTIPVRVVEHGRFVRIEANSKADALKMFRRQEWIDMSDHGTCDVFKTGACKEERPLRD